MNFRKGNDYPAMEGLAARFGPYMDKINKEHMEQQQQRFPAGASTTATAKRHGSPLPLPSPPVLPPKKQHLDDHPDYRLPRGKHFL
jgi:hypothetical protein